MRTWQWRFMADWGERWGIVQDVWWCNTAVLPSGVSIRGNLARPATKACVWLGSPDCHRDQAAVLLPLGDWVNRKGRCYESRKVKTQMPSGQGVAIGRVVDTAVRRGGSTPFNYLLITRGGPENRSNQGHPASTPVELCRWWVRYICPPGGVVLDPFAGSGTTGVAALVEGRKAVLIERHPPYCDIIRKRLRGVTPALV